MHGPPGCLRHKLIHACYHNAVLPANHNSALQDVSGMCHAACYTSTVRLLTGTDVRLFTGTDAVQRARGGGPPMCTCIRPSSRMLVHPACMALQASACYQGVVNGPHVTTSGPAAHSSSVLPQRGPTSACYQNAARRPHVARTRPSRLPQTFSTSNLKLQTFSMSNLTSRTSPSKNNILHQDVSCISLSKNNILHQDASCISPSKNNILHQDTSCISLSKNNILHQDASCISPSKNNILHQDTSCISPSKNNILHQNVSCISLSRNNILHQDVSCISPSKSTSPASKHILHKKNM